MPDEGRKFQVPTACIFTINVIPCDDSGPLTLFRDPGKQQGDGLALGN